MFSFDELDGSESERVPSWAAWCHLPLSLYTGAAAFWEPPVKEADPSPDEHGQA